MMASLIKIIIHSVLGNTMGEFAFKQNAEDNALDTTTHLSKARASKQV